MNFELKLCNIVLIGAFNPLDFDRYFFIKNEIINGEEIDGQPLFLPELVQLIIPNFQIIINHQQIIINEIKSNNDSDEIAKILIKIVESSSTVIITGSGLNFNWFISESNEGKTVAELSKELCFNNNNKIQTSFFNDGDAKFGFYSSMDMMNTRLKLDAKPINYREIGKLEEGIALKFEFNFHKDYKERDKSKTELVELLQKYADYKNKAKEIIEVLK